MSRNKSTTRPYLALVVVLAAAIGCDVAEQSPPPPGVAATSEASQAEDGSVPFVKGYSEGFTLAQSEGKPMLVFFTAGWCNFCQQMARETFHDEQIVEWSGQFVCIQVDADVEPDICRQFRVKGYPTVQFLSPQGVPLNRVVGKRAPDQLLSQMQAALGATASRSAPTVLR